MNYEMMSPPFELIPFSEMKKREAKRYFEWYIGEIPSRMKMLEDKLKEDGVISNLEYSEELLVPIWKWYEDNIHLRASLSEEYAIKQVDYLEWMADFFSKKDISPETLVYGMDLAMFLGEVLVRNNLNLEWGFFTGKKKAFSVNEPIIMGFSNGDEMDPRRLVMVMTLKSIREKDSTRLFNIYKVWEKMV